MTNNLDLSALNNLSKEERDYALKLLKQLSIGDDSEYNKLMYSDYKEIPVDIETFITDDRYLGKAWKDTSGKLKLYPFWLERLKEIFPTNVDTNYNTVLESGARGIGKAQPLYSKVLTDTGFIPMSDIVVGSRVFGNDGEIHNVTHIFPQGTKDIFEVTFDDCTSCRCCGEHLWTVYENGSEKTLELKDIMRNGIVNNGNYVYSIPTTESIKFYGESIKCDGVGKCSNKIPISERYLISNISTRTAILSEMIESFGTEDGDGILLTNIEHDCVNGIQFIINSLGLISIVLNKSIFIYKYGTRRYIKSIEYIGKEECKCILLDYDKHLYLTDNFIVTHNSEIACGCIGTYLLYRIMCLKNPLEFFHLKATEKICFAFMNIKLDLAEQIANDKFQNTIQLSPWFMPRGTMTQRNNKPYWIPPEPIQFIIGSQSDDVIGLPIYFSFFDEVSFLKNQDLDKQKAKAKDMIDTAIGGMFTRFVYNGKNPTVLVVASSKRSEQSFMESYIKQLSESDPEHTIVIDKPVWEVKPPGTYSNEYFYIGLGNKFLESIIIPEEHYDQLNTYKDKGYSILKVPMFFRSKFVEDIDRALCDFAGISTSSANKYISAQMLQMAIRDNFMNPFPDIIECGNSPDDKTQYYNYFNMSAIPRELMSKPLFVHLDMSINGDMTGIAGTWIIGKKPSVDEELQSRDLFFRVAFSTSIKAPKGRQISFEKNRNFIRWLRDAGFNVKEVTSDTFQSADLLQILSAENFKCSILSVDRVDKDSTCKPYLYLKNTLYEQRIQLYRSQRLNDEFLDIERNMNTGKIDHTPNGHKDALDAVCGSVFTASKYASEYAYDYGETYDIMNDVTNNATSYENVQKQITIDFEEEMKKIFESTEPTSRPQDIDFGFGPATDDFVQLGNGIFIW